MKKIYSKNQLKNLKKYSTNVVKNILEVIEVLNENYGADRNIDEDGGYVLIIECKKDVKNIEKNILKGILPEYTDVIECSGGVKWTSSLYLLSSDFSVVVIANEELSKILLE